MKPTNDSEIGKQEVKWVPAAKVQGELAAEVLASHLRAMNIPVQVWQESVGSTFGFSIGPLGSVSVMVLEKDLPQAKEIIKEGSIPKTLDNGEIDDEQLEEGVVSNFSKGALAVTAIAVNPVGAIMGALLSQLPNSSSVLDVECPYCGVTLALDEYELEQGWFTCPECNEETNIVIEE